MSKPGRAGVSDQADGTGGDPSGTTGERAVSDHVLVINAGSYLVKYSLIDDRVRRGAAAGVIEQIRESPAASLTRPDGERDRDPECVGSTRGHEGGLGRLRRPHGRPWDEVDLAGRGPPGLHGGSWFGPTGCGRRRPDREGHRIDAAFAPLHNPPTSKLRRRPAALPRPAEGGGVRTTRSHQDACRRGAYVTRLPAEWLTDHGIRRFRSVSTDVPSVRVRGGARFARAGDGPPPR
jgi:acetate kinase